MRNSVICGIFLEHENGVILQLSAVARRSFTCFTLAIQCNLDSTVSQSIASLYNLSSIVTSALASSTHSALGCITLYWPWVLYSIYITHHTWAWCMSYVIIALHTFLFLTVPCRAYGVLLWEIASYGESPLQDYDTQAIIKLAEHKELSHCLPKWVYVCMYICTYV